MNDDYHIYEIIQILNGIEHTVLKTDDPDKMAVKYTEMHMNGHNMIRLKVDGKVLTIRESDKLGYKKTLEARIRRDRKQNGIPSVRFW